MNFPLMKDIVEYTQKLTKETGKEFALCMTTNLSLLDEEKLAFIQEHKIAPLVSFNGPKEIQDERRPFKNGGGSSYDATVPKIKKLLSVIPDACCRATLLEDVDPLNVRKALCDIGFAHISIAPASESLLNETGRYKERNLTGTMQMTEADAETFLKNVKERNIKNLKKQKEFVVLCSFLDGCLNKKKKYFPCGAGRGFVGISNSGDVYLCHRFVGADNYRLGSIFDEKIEREVYLKPSSITVEKCSKCCAKYICAGGCYHDNLGKTGSVFEAPEDVCGLMQRTMELTAYVSCNLDEKDREYLVKEEIISKRSPTKEELRERRQELIEEMEGLGLTEEEFKELAGGLTLDEYKEKTGS